MGQWAETSPDEFTALLQELVNMHKQVHCTILQSIELQSTPVVLRACSLMLLWVRSTKLSAVRMCARSAPASLQNAVAATWRKLICVTLLIISLSSTLFIALCYHTGGDQALDKWCVPS
jgi:hypothetical protein